MLLYPAKLPNYLFALQIFDRKSLQPPHEIVIASPALAGRGYLMRLLRFILQYKRYVRNDVLMLVEQDLIFDLYTLNFDLSMLF